MPSEPNRCHTQRRWFWSLVPITVLDRYLICELVVPFGFGVGTFSAIGLTGGVLFELVRQLAEARVPLSIALQFLGLQIPYFISLAFPMAVLLAVLMTFGRLSQNGELTALRACGISVNRLLLSAVGFSFIVAGLTFVFNEAIVPGTRYQAKILLESVVSQRQFQFQERDVFYQEYGDNRQVRRLFYAQSFDGQKLSGLTVLDFSQPSVSQVINAESALWDPIRRSWTFFNGTLYLVTTEGANQNILTFAQQQVQIPQNALDFKQPQRDPAEMNIAEAEQALRGARRAGQSKTARKLEIRIQQKYALPFVCVVFAAIGVALGAQPRRSNATGFGMSVLIILSYYICFFVSDVLGSIGLLTPAMTAWLPNGLGLGVSSWLWARATR